MNLKDSNPIHALRRSRAWVTLPLLLLTATALAQQSGGLPFETAPAVLEEAPLERLYDGQVEAVNQAPFGAILEIQIRDPGGNMVEGFRPKIDRRNLPLTRMASSAHSPSVV